MDKQPYKRHVVFLSRLYADLEYGGPFCPICRSREIAEYEQAKVESLKHEEQEKASKEYGRVAAVEEAQRRKEKEAAQIWDAAASALVIIIVVVIMGMKDPESLNWTTGLAVPVWLLAILISSTIRGD